ncbi:murein biosynthesis integral membrane protein MurJ [Lacibacterium aquatile]|uniref:Probable lipid II flippase MurJ n=1 Tax=Lacibacterium aquatile TaxID=1168082 RepID=A0ABW5DUJ9_9PROT
MSLTRAFATVGSLTLLSRVLGFIRDMMMAAVLGAGPVADAFVVAFKLPNFFRRLFGEGAFNAAFVPVFAGLLATDGRRAALIFAEQAMACLLGALLIFTVLAEAGMPLLTAAMAPGFIDDPERFGLTVDLGRITFPYLLLVSLAALQSGILNSVERYGAAAFTPVLLNLCMIAAMIFLPKYTQTEGHALAWGVVASGIAQFVWLAISCGRAGVPVGLRRPRLSPKVREMLRTLGPALIAGGVAHINVMVDMIIASLLPAGAISWLYYADRVAQLPLGVVGAAVATTLLPVLSRQIRGGDKAAALSSQNKALEYALILTMPAAAGLVALALPITVVLFQRGLFTAADAIGTAGAMAAFSAGLPAFVVAKALATNFFARGDTKTPMRFAIICLVANVVLNLALMPFLAHVGVALATSLSSWLNVAMLCWTLSRQGHLVMDKPLQGRLWRLLIVSIVMGGALWVVVPYAMPHLAAGQPWRYPLLAGLVAGGGLVYAILGQVLGAFSLKDILRLLRRSR